MFKINPKDIRSARGTYRVTAKENEILQRLYRQSTCRSMSEYIRMVVLRKPVNIRYRNESLDETLEELSDMRMDLKTVLQHIEERREKNGQGTAGDSSAMDAILEQELLPLIKHILERISDFSNIWSQYSRVIKV